LHLTVARLERPWPRPAVERFLGWGAELELEPFECPEAVLFESRLQPGGAVYTAMERFPLA
jgi:2'-5' RNA ligase